MKKGGILNGAVMGELTELRHMDELVICDAGFPVPRECRLIDLSLTEGVPSLLQTLRAVLNEVIFEEYTVFSDLESANPEYYGEITSLLHRQRQTKLSPELFMARAVRARLFIRTGDLQPFSNIILTSASGAHIICSELDVCC